MQANDLRNKTVDELKAELIELNKEAFNLRMQKATEQLQKTHLAKAVKKNIARVKTVITQKELAAKASVKND